MLLCMYMSLRLAKAENVKQFFYVSRAVSCILALMGPLNITRERTSISLELPQGQTTFFHEDKESHFSLYGQGKKLSISQLTTAAASQLSILLRKVQKSPKEKRNLRIGFLDGRWLQINSRIA